jgi:AcrR family transcriptional regulator
MHDPPLRLRDRQRAELRAEIDRVALRLFAEQGFDAVTTEAIAEGVGISPSTFFRHVQSKEQLLLGVVQRGRAQILSTFHGRPAEEDVVDSVAAAVLARTAQFVNQDGTVELWRRAMASAPVSLRRASLLADVERDELIAMVAKRLGTSVDRDLRAGVLVRTTLAAAEYAYEWWLTHGSAESLHALTQRSLELAKERPRGGAARMRSAGSA